MLHQLHSILAFCLLTLAAFGLGRPILRGLGVAEDDRLSVAVWSITLGLIAAGMAILALGLVGLLYVPVIGAGTAVACVYGPRELLRKGRQGAFEGVETTDAPWSPPGRWITRGVLAAAGAACLGSLMAALAPPTAGDALCYHLELPKTFLIEHRILHLPWHDNSALPLLTEMWYLWALALDGGVCAQLVHWGLGILLGLATVLLASPILGRPWAWFAGAVVVLTPGVNNQMTAPLNDVAMAALTALAAGAWWRAAVNDESRRWFVLAGLAAGGALGTKYIAIMFAAAVGATWLGMLLRQPQRRPLLLQGAGVVTVVALSVGGPWYLRTAWYHGNPVYPFLGDWLDNQFAPGERPETAPLRKSPLGRGLLALASGPWQVTMQPERFGGRGHQLGVLLLAGLPGVLVGRRLRGLGLSLTIAGCYWVLWQVLRQNVRFLLPVVPLLSIGVVWAWITLRRFPAPPRILATAAFAGIVVVMATVGLGRAREKLAVAVGWEDRDTYLQRHVPTYPAAAVANRLLDTQAHILSQDYRSFYFNCRVTREVSLRRSDRYDLSVTQPAELGRRLRERGFTHLLLAEAIAAGVPYDTTLSHLVDAQLATAAADELCTLTDYRYHDGDGALRRYRLIMLRNAAP